MARYPRTVPADRHGGEGVVPRGGRALALATLCTLLFLTFLDNTVVSVALGDVQVSLHAGVTDLQWVVGAYALTQLVLRGSHRGSDKAAEQLSPARRAAVLLSFLDHPRSASGRGTAGQA